MRTTAASRLMDVIDVRLPRGLDDLPEEIPLPQDTVCVFMSGSLVTGWGHATSDVDLYVVTDTPAKIAATAMLDLGLSADPVSVVTVYGPNEQCYDTEYWTCGQVEELLDAVASSAAPPVRPSTADVDCLYRLQVGVALVGAEWLHEAQQRLSASALPLLLAGNAFGAADSYLNDAVGLLEAGDDESAVLAARQAFGHAIDGYLAAKGSICPKEKWRYRKLSECPGGPLSLADYWAIETMSDLNPMDARPWVMRVVDVCNSLIMEVDFGDNA